MSKLEPTLERFRNANENPDYDKGLNVALRRALRLYASAERLEFVVSYRGICCACSLLTLSLSKTMPGTYTSGGVGGTPIWQTSH